MDLTINPKVDLSETSPLMLGGVDFRVAPLVLRQSSVIGEKLPDVLAILNRRMSAFVDHPNAAAAAIAQATGEPLPSVPPEEGGAFLRALSLSEAESNLLAGIVRIGLSRVYPRITLDDILDLPIRSGDLIEAANAIIEASRLTERKVPAAGEAVATNR